MTTSGNKTNKTRLSLLGAFVGGAAVVGVLALIPLRTANRSNNAKPVTPDVAQNCQSNRATGGDMEDVAYDCLQTRDFSTLAEALPHLPFIVYEPIVHIDDSNLQDVTVSEVPNGATSLYLTYLKGGSQYQVTQENQISDGSVAGKKVSIAFAGNTVAGYYHSSTVEGKAASSLTWTNNGISYDLSVNEATSEATMVSIAESFRARK